MNEIKENYHDNASVVLIGNKIDLDGRRVASTEGARELANSLGVAYIETSAKTAVGIEESLFKIAVDLKSKIVPKIEPIKPQIIEPIKTSINRAKQSSNNRARDIT